MARVLVVDDDEQVRKLLTAELQENDLEVVTTDGGRKAIELYKQRQFDVVILDIIMPDMEGVEAIRALKKIDPSVKVIAISGGGKLSGDHYLSMIKTFRPHYTFPKPVDIDEVITAIRRLLPDGT
ncbi:MAG: response regulator [Spirochaetia bacterium]